MSYPDWNSETGKICLSEIDQVFEKTIKDEEDFFGPVFLFSCLKNNKEYYRILQSLCCDTKELPLFMNSEFEAVELVIKTRLKYGI